MKIPYIPLILGLFFAILIFYAGCNCGRNTAPSTIITKHDTIPEYKEFEGLEHAQIPSETGPTQNQVFTPAEQKTNRKLTGGTVDRQHDLTVKYPVNPGDYDNPDTLKLHEPLHVDTSSGWLKQDFPDNFVIDSSEVQPFSDSLRAHGFKGHLEYDKRWGLVAVYDSVQSFTDHISLREYWKGNQLFVDASSEKGTVTAIRSRAVYKEPRIFWGPSITVSYNGRLLVIPGISIVYALRLGSKH